MVTMTQLVLMIVKMLSLMLVIIMVIEVDCKTSRRIW